MKIEDGTIIEDFGKGGLIVSRSPFSSLISRKEYSHGLSGFNRDKLP